MSDFDYMLRLGVEKQALTSAELEAAAAKTHTQPSEAQKEVGNYRKGRAAWKGLELVIENPKDSIRSGVGKDGKAWSTTMKDHYGYFGATKSKADGDAVDFFLNDEHLDSEIVFVVNQNNEDGTFDEGKVILGCITEEAAVETYLRNYSRDWTGFGSIVPLTLPQFKRWLTDGNTARPIRDSDVSVKTGAARSSAAARVSGLVADEGPVLQRKEQAVPVLRGEGHHGLSKMAGQLLSVLLGHGTETDRDCSGPPQQRQELHTDELPLGNAYSSVAKQTKRAEVHVQWENLNFAKMGGSSWHASAPSANATSTIRLDTKASLHDTSERTAQDITFDHAQRDNADATGVGRGNGNLAGDNRLSPQQGLVSAASTNGVTAPQYVRIHADDENGNRLMHHYIRKAEWGPPAGRIELGETPLQAALRELKERAGYEGAEADFSDGGVDGDFHVFNVPSGKLKQIAKPGELGGYATEVRFDPVAKTAAYVPQLWFVKRADDDEQPFTICVDLDGTLAEKEEPFSNETIGEPIEAAIEYVRKFKEAGARIIIFTVRGDTKLVSNWLDEHDVPFDFVNHNPDQPEDSSGKVIADVYWDDRAYNAEDPHEHGPAILDRITEEEDEGDLDQTDGPVMMVQRTTTTIMIHPHAVLAGLTEQHHDDES